MKTCNKCGIEKTLDGFSPDPRMKDGHLNCCRACKRSAIADRRNRVRLQGPVKVITEKRCNVCARVKPVSLFNRSSGCLDGYASRCKECDAKKMAEYRKENRPAYNAYMREYNGKRSPYERYLAEILRRYGCTQEMYEMKLAEQDGKCSICRIAHNDKKRNGRLYVDHCHTTKNIRGLLCHACNCAIGYANDDTRVLAEAIAYLARHKKAA